jgi:hypothetical protein
MRITYYQFPDEMSIRDVALITKQVIEGKTYITEVPADVSDETLERNFKYEVDTTITMAKKLMKAYGGRAYTRHIDRDGGCFEVTPIVLKGNNSKHRYNVHL